MKRITINILLIMLLMTLFSCGDSGATLKKSSKKLKYPELPVVTEGVQTAFDEKGDLVWPWNKESCVYIDYLADKTAGSSVVAMVESLDERKAFSDQLSDIDKVLIFAIKNPPGALEKIFTDFLFGSKGYSAFLNMDDQYFTAYISKTDCFGFLWFRISDIEEKNDCYYSVYIVELDDYKTLQKTLESLEKKEETRYGKPVVYLYPKTATDITITLDFKGRLIYTEPLYQSGWWVTAYPDGRLVNITDGKEYKYLFWEGLSRAAKWNLAEGYCVAGNDTEKFLEEVLSSYGLKENEYSEFIEFWLPKMQDNPYNLITFQWQEYEEVAELIINPLPDSILRVFMVYAALEAPIEVKTPEARQAFVRNGFSVIEWGGSRVEYVK